jgi:hypothetical protein
LRMCSFRSRKRALPYLKTNETTTLISMKLDKTLDSNSILPLYFVGLLPFIPDCRFGSSAFLSSPHV